MKKTLLLMGLACTTVLPVPAQTKTTKLVKVETINPLMKPSGLPFQAPDFGKIKPEHYMPAFKAAIAQQLATIKSIKANKQQPTFANTIVPFENSSATLDRVTSAFFCLTGAHKTPEIQALEKEIIPMLTDLDNKIMFDQQLFQRIKQVYDKEYTKLKGEDKKLLEVMYKGFVRSGALLPTAKKARMEQINNRMAVLQQEFGTMLPKSVNDATVWVEKESDLAGLSAADIAQCKRDAETRGGKAPYCIVIANTTQQAILSSLDNRELREKVFHASVHRADGTGQHNTFPIIAELAKLRAEKAQLMGFNTYAAYSLDNTMAKNTTNVYAFLNRLIDAYKPKADAETKEIEAYARQTMGADFQLQPYDRFYYSAKMKKEKFNFSEDEVKPYFNIDSVLVNGVFYAANKVFGLSFKERHDVPTYHPDMKVYDVIDKDGKTLALFYTDYFRRPTKRGGAWMSSFVKQSKARKQQPVIYNVCNYAKAPEGQPTLLNWDEVTTMFHEFGHGLHGMLSNCNYHSLSGTAVTRDFVELPSQFNEYFAAVSEVFDNYARHYATNQPMPADLKKRMFESLNYHSAYALGENLAATCVDLAWHNVAVSDVPAAEQAKQFEADALKKVGLLNPQILPRYSTSYFNHVWGGGYAAGYYSYLWSEVLSENVGEYFTQHGALNSAVGQAYRDKIVSRGNTGDLMQMFTDFTGLKEPDANALIKARGL